MTGVRDGPEPVHFVGGDRWDRLGSCVMDILGRNWAGRTPEGGRRLDNPKDFVRIEIEAALARSTPVIPVLVEKVTMAVESELPPALAALAPAMSLMSLTGGISTSTWADSPRESSGG